MEIGTDVWLRDKIGDLAWIPGTIHSKKAIDEVYYNIIVKSSSSGQEFSYKVKLGDNDADIDDIKLRNALQAGESNDLINLPYLHEPAILHCLEHRYSNSDIYTYTGPILIAVNPFKKVNLYTPQTLELYYNAGLLKSQGIDSPQKLAPHVYAVADAAYRNMMTGIHGSGGFTSNNSTNCNQAILISGESGAGKTESTKIVLKYLTTVGSTSGIVDSDQSSVMEKILQSNPILEAFGNARTIRNDNSSRFGKFIELNFNRRGNLIGGMIRTYLLEKVRLPTQQAGERNFHIFYQMARGGNTEELKDWGILPIEDYWYTNQGGIFELQHVDDKEEFTAMKIALTTLNFDANTQIEMFRCLAGLLHLGQLQFISDRDGEGSEVARDEENVKHLFFAATLCGLDVNFIAKTLTIRVINASGDVYQKKLTKIQASDARDALTKAIYGTMFQFIVNRINLSIEVDKKNVRADIGVLDIFGFECFRYNSFEQLCINYTNETLQQQFNQFVFKMEQIEYQKENIEWSFVEFPDNQDCLDLIEHKQQGIFAMIDDECKLPGASDERLHGRMVKALVSHSRFSASVTQKRDYLFCVHHYAGPVVYSVITFVDKNKDELPRETYTLLQSSTSPLLVSLFQSKEISSKTNDKNSKINEKNSPNAIASVGSQFKDQLSKLMEKIYSTSPHYIRCLKPNDQNIPDTFHRVRTTEQLRYGGVLEAVRVARSGFPVRLGHGDFYARYRPLLRPQHAYKDISRFMTNFTNTVNSKALPRIITASYKNNTRNLCNDLLTVFFDENNVIRIPNIDGTIDKWKVRKVKELSEWSNKLEVSRESIQLGLTKVFLRKNAHDILEYKRSKRMTSAAVTIQCNIRSFIVAKKYLICKLAIATIQRAVRVYFAYRRVRQLRELRACILIQAQMRKFVFRYRFINLKSAVVALQSCFRLRVARREAFKLRYSKYSLRLQAICRCLLAVRKYHRFRRALIQLQNKRRCFLARQELRKLRVAARDIGTLKQSNESLKAEIEALKSKALQDAKRLQMQLRLESEAKSSQQRDDEILNLKVVIEELKETLKNQVSIRESKELELLEATKRISVLEQELETQRKGFASEREGYRLQLNQTSLRIVQLEAENKVLMDLKASSANLSTLTVGSSNPTLTRTRSDTATAGSASFGSVGTTVQTPPEPRFRRPESIRMKREANSAGNAFNNKSNDNGDANVEQELNLMKTNEKASEIRDIIKKFDKGRPKLSIDEIKSPSAIPTPIGSPSNVNVSSTPYNASNTNYNGFNTPTTGSTVPEEDYSRLFEILQSERAAKGVLEEEVSRLRLISLDLNAQVESLRKQLPGKGRVPSKTTSTLDSDGKDVKKGLTTHFSTEAPAIVEKFEKNVELLQKKLVKGIQGQVWEGSKIAKIDVNITLDVAGKTLIFTPIGSSRRFNLFMRVEVEPVSLSSIMECMAGADIPSESSDDFRFLSIVASSEGSSPRVLAVKVNTKEERNALITSLRALISNSQIHSSDDFNATGAIRTTKKTSVRDSVLQGTLSSPASPAGGSAASKLTFNSNSALNRERTRSISNKINASAVSVDVGPFADSASANSTDQMKHLLLVEQSKNEKNMYQIFQLTNDLLERDDQIALLKRKDMENAQILAAKDKMYEQDAMVRMQLGKRLEQVLMDKEEALENLEMMKEQLSILKESLNHIGTQGRGSFSSSK